MMTRRYALRDDPWERIQDLLPGSKGWVGVTAKTACLSTRCGIAIEPGFPGGIGQIALGMIAKFIPVSDTGPKQVCGSESLPPVMPWATRLGFT